MADCQFIHCATLLAIFGVLAVLLRLSSITMAAAIVLNNYLLNVLLINDVEVRNALNVQGLTALTDFVSLTDKDIKNICANVRKPGGTIVNPLAANPTNHQQSPILECSWDIFMSAAWKC